MPSSALKEAFDAACSAIAQDMPLHMQGAGATYSPETASLLSALTVQYMGKLVDAALDACYNQFPDAPLPCRTSKTVKRKATENWNDPLPQPKILKPENSATTKDPARAQWFEDDDDENEDDSKPKSQLDDDWVGLVGVDLYRDRRRPPQSTAALSAQHFVFCLCHDTYLYGKIRKIQTEKQTNFLPLLLDPVIQDTVEQQGALLEEERRRKRKHDPKKAKKGGDTSDPEDDDEGSAAEEADPEEEEEGPSWPGLNDLLPPRRTKE